MNVTCNRATRPGASEKAQAVPIIGALGGAAVNYADARNDLRAIRNALHRHLDESLGA